MSSVKHVALRTLLLGICVTTNVYAGHNNPGHGGHRYHKHENHGRHVERTYVEHRYIERQPYYVVQEEYYRPRHYHHHDRHCGHYVTTRERVVYQDNYYPSYDSNGFGLESLTIHLR